MTDLEKTRVQLEQAEADFLRARGWRPWSPPSPLGLPEAQLPVLWEHPAFIDLMKEHHGVATETALAWERYPSARPPGLSLLGA